MSDTTYTPGSLIHVRGRDWVVETDSTPDLLHLRPLAGSDAESAYIIPELESEAPRPSTFPMPRHENRGSLAEARLLQDAMRMKLRAGAGPFRSFGNIAVEPRTYQLVPLLMALRQETVRLLIADDVGVGKTIEAGLVVRELMDRGEISRFAVLAPPNLVEQWKAELATRFNIHAVVVTSSSVKALERKVPPGRSLFTHYPATIISLDYIKSENHRYAFINNAPECLVVDEAHTCTSVGSGRQQRFELLRDLAADPARHLLLLTATPHSGIEAGFYNLLSLLDEKFGRLADVGPKERKLLREQLARHLVQRRRVDVEQFLEDAGLFPRRIVGEIPYQLTGEWGEFFNDVREYCSGIASEKEEQGSRMIWYATLALLRCVASSPAAAVSALGAGVPLEEGATDDVLDGLLDQEEQPGMDDMEPPAPDSAEPSARQLLMERARGFYGRKQDPKLACLLVQLAPLLEEGFRPIVFCQYVATAQYVAEEIAKAFPTHTVDAVTGRLSPDEREWKVEELCGHDGRILVATNCLSEGINLQDGFDAVIHYDLAWNPTRHEQREGRVDRYGQASPRVKCLLMYAEDSPIDGFILNVILRKSQIIRDELGVQVPMPENREAISRAMIRAALMRRRETHEWQGMLAGFEEMEIEWRNAAEEAVRNRTLFAQSGLKPEEVLPEWNRQKEQTGTHEDVEIFVREACTLLGAPLDVAGEGYRLNTANLPEPVRDIFRDPGREHDAPKQYLLNFDPRRPLHYVPRCHPLVSALADYLMEQALESESPAVHRMSVVRVASPLVEKITRLYFIRLRHRLVFEFNRRKRHIMAEEAVVAVRRGQEPFALLTAQEWNDMRNLQPSGNVPGNTAEEHLRQAVEQFEAAQDAVHALAEIRASELLQDHLRVRAASRLEAGSVQVESCRPVDVIAVSVLIPEL